MTTKEKEERDVDYMWPILLLGWRITILFGTGVLLWLFVTSPRLVGIHI